MTGHSQLVQTLISADQPQYRSSHRLVVSLGDRAVPDLLQALKNAASQRDQWRLLLALAEIGGEAVVPTMIAFLRSPSSAIRALAAQFLGKAGDPRAVEPMLALMTEVDNEFTLMWVVQALGLLGDPRAVEPLARFLAQTESSTERYMAIEALGLLGNPKAVDDIRKHVFDQDHHVRDRAEIALRRLNGEAV